MRAVTCPHCEHPLQPDELIARATVSWPHKRWFALACPGCGGTIHVAAFDGSLTVGTLDGAPGPSLIPHRVAAVAGLTVQERPESLELSWGDEQRAIPAKERAV